MNITMFGIPNCNTIKKARDWLEVHGVDYTFHNYKKEGITEATLQDWCEHVEWEVLLNRRGTTWRKLSDEDKADLKQVKAVKLMVANPSMIKRPVLQDMDSPANILVGFDEAHYSDFFKQA